MVKGNLNAASQKLLQRKKATKKTGISSTLLLCTIVVFVIVGVILMPSTVMKIENSSQLLLKQIGSQSNSFIATTEKLLPTFRQFHHNKPQIHNNDKLSRNGRQRVAYAITITKDGFFQDGAAILAYSVMNISRNADYDFSLVAFVHPNVSISRPILQNLGFHVIEIPKPINVSAIDDKFVFLKTKIDKNGCCGASELIKLNAYRLVIFNYNTN